MSRQIQVTVVLFSVLFAGFASEANACGGLGRFRSSFRPTIRYSQPVVRVQPQTVVRHTQKVVVVPAPKRPELPTVPAGSTLTLPANFLGQQPGDVFMVFNKIKLPVKVLRWQPTGVTIVLPPMAIKTAVEIRLDIVLANGNLAASRQVRVAKPASVVLHPTSPVSPLPTQAAIQQSTPNVAPPTQPVAIANLPGPAPTQPQQVQPKIGQPIIHSQGPPQANESIDIENNPILQEHAEPETIAPEVTLPETPVAPTNQPISALQDSVSKFAKLIGG
ncbi:MAG: hypothetical protein KDB27_14390 [Planctomycetales bacterium]|nr:hypothetical protein [Planctomycetales bacterium]